MAFNTNSAACPALFAQATSGTAALFLQFGGQGNSYFQELRAVYQHPEVQPLVRAIARDLASLGDKEETFKELPRGLDLSAWLEDPSSVPSEEYLFRTPVAYPLSFLTQACVYLATVHDSGVPLEDFVKSVKGAVGHSSGVVAAICAAMSDSVEALEKNIHAMTIYMFWHGVRCQQQFPLYTLPPDVAAARPTPMLAISGLSTSALNEGVQAFNRSFREGSSRAVSIGLVNGIDRHIVVGHPQSLHSFHQSLASTVAEPDAQQGRVPFSQRKPVVAMEFLNTTVPFHSTVLQDAVDIILRDVNSAPSGSFLASLVTLRGSTLKFPVYSTLDGSDLRAEQDILTTMVRMQTVEQLDWMKATGALMSESETPVYALDFGPGGARGIVSFSSKLLEGHGVQFVCASKYAADLPRKGSLVAGPEVLSERDVNALPRCESWSAVFGPKLVRIGDEGQIALDTRFARLLGRPPIIVPGMTPWSHAPQVAACFRAGFHAELAGGGIPLPHLFDKEIRDLAVAMPPGAGVSVNLLFLNPYLWGYQFPKVQELCQKGEPIDSITVAAGVPSKEKARDIVAACEKCHMRFISFKPGTAATIREVLALANEHLSMFFVIQWTGGRAGGHHSFEDQFAPLLETYAEIRRCSNVLLVVGGGIGDGEGAWNWLSGEWSVPLGYAKMPADGVLMGSRMMATRESFTAEGAKDQIVAAVGIENQADWERSYDDDAGGIITVQSELGEPIHVIKNKASDVWREFDRRFFGDRSPQEMLAALRASKEEVIAKLNDSYQKPWFGKKLDGRAVDLGEMTYEEVCLRLVEVGYYPGDMPNDPHSRWFDVTFRDRVHLMLVRTEERFCAEEKLALITSSAQLEKDPESVIMAFFDAYPRARETRLWAEDSDYFISEICMNPRRKPINFVPRIDESFKRYFKVDSLWYSEDLASIPGRDMQKALIIHGPVAAKFTGSKQETVSDVLNRISDVVQQHALNSEYGGQVEKVPIAPYLELLRSPRANNSVEPVTETVEGDIRTVQIADELPSMDAWVSLLCEVDGQLLPGSRWLYSLLTSPTIVRGDRRAPNILRNVLAPMAQTETTLEMSSGKIRKVSVKLLRKGVELSESPNVEIVYDDSTNAITAAFNFSVPVSNQRTKVEQVSLTLNFVHRAEMVTAPIHEVIEGHNEAVKRFYSEVWLTSWDSAEKQSEFTCLSPHHLNDDDFFLGFDKADGGPLQQVSSQHLLSLPSCIPSKSTFTHTESFSVEQVHRFCDEVGHHDRVFLEPSKLPTLPVDFAIVAGWQSLIQSVINDSRLGSVDLLRLLHLENRFKLLRARNMVNPVDSFSSDFSLVEITNTPNGKRCTGRGLVSHEGAPWVIVTSTFFVPWSITNSEEETKAVGQPMQIENRQYLVVLDDELIEVVKSKRYFVFAKDAPALQVGDVLQVDMTCVDKINGKQLDCDADGTLHVFRGNAVLRTVGSVSYHVKDVKGNALLSFLNRVATEQPAYCPLDAPYRMLAEPDSTVAPISCERYSMASNDRNPIHTDAIFARLAGLKEPIVHGMWLSANASRVIFNNVGKPEYLRCEFVNKVRPGSKIYTQLTHVGMREGLVCLEFECVDDEGSVVVKGVADAIQRSTATVFTGQGSATKGMGMDLYASSSAARAVWDRADKHFLKTYGISLLDIVRENPTSKTVYFGGVAGNYVRASLRKMKKAVVLEDGSVDEAPVFPDITEQSVSHTFASPKGLLYATQFAQPCQVILALTQYNEVKDKLLLPNKTMFAGHSLGEYAAISAVSGNDLFELEDLLDLMFMRGMTMQQVVKRNSKQQSDYGMVAVDPTRISKDCTPQFILSVVKDLEQMLLKSKAEALLQIVNFNVEPTQYVVAGDRLSLHAFMHVCDALKKVTTANRVKITEVPPDTILTAVQAALKDLEAVPSGGVLELVRGKATIPLDGIDVPFHSKLLLSEVPHFRKLLQAKLKVANLSSFVGRYVPNLVGRPFSFSKEFAQQIFSSTSSPVIEQHLPSWEQSVQKNPEEIGRMLVIELLAYQFAFPVLWIETTDFLLREANVTKVIELGPGPVLKNMLRVALDKNPRFLALKGEVVNLAYAADEKRVFFRLKDQGVTAGEASVAASDRTEQDPSHEAEGAVPHVAVAAAASPAQPAGFSPPTAAIVPTVQSSVATAGPEIDVAPKALDALRIILANRLGKTVEAIPESATIKQLSGGKSALQNEIVGELGKEFDGDSDNAAEQPLSALASAIGASYKKLGQLTTNMLDRVVKDKLPAGTSISSLRGALKSEYMLSTESVEGVLLRAISMAPAARLEDSTAASWRAAIVAKFGEDEGVLVGRRGSSEGSASADGAAVVAAMDPKMASKLKQLAARINEAYANFLDDTSIADMRASLQTQKAHSTALEKRHTALIAEVGEVFESGVQPLFDLRKVRQYSHWWAIAKMNAVELIEDLASGKVDLSSQNARDRLFRLGNCMTGALKDILLRSAEDLRKDGFESLADVLSSTAHSPRSGFFTSRDQPTAPQTKVSAEGRIVYKDVPRSGEDTMLDYVQAMEEASKGTEWVPPISMQRTDANTELGQNSFDARTTKAYFDALRQLVSEGISFKGKVAFISGVSPGSITEPIVGALLEGGCTVIVSTRLQSTNFSFFQTAYEQHCGAGSRLIVVPFNQASVGDVDRALEYIYAAPEAGGLGLDVDFCFPFAALSENGRGIGDIDAKSELAHRIMLTNVLRMTGKIKNLKQDRHLLGRTTLFVVPMSPNHGVFGSDGLYAESKLGLESLFHKWHSESLGDYISVVGAVIGWTRGTSLMSANNVVADHMEALGCRCFSSSEMAFNLIGLLHPTMLNECQVRPIHANLTGGLQAVVNLSEKMAMRRQQLSDQARIATAVLKETTTDAQIESAGGVANAESQDKATRVFPRCCPSRASSRVFPLPTNERLDRLRQLEGMVDPASVVVVTGFGEVGPWGGSFTRWEMEADGEFSIEGCMRMAWLMGLVRYFDGRLVDSEGRPFMYSGWVDVATGQPVKDWEMKKRYESQILAHSGIRIWEGELFWDYKPQEGSKFYHCVVLDETLKAVEVPDQETAEQFKQMHGEQCDIYAKEGVWFVQLQKGAKMYIPRALRRDRWVAGQVPTGWDPKRFGIPDDIIRQVDRGTLFTMVAFVEALMAAGITDPYEFYEYVHFSKVGNAVGSGIGGTHALRQMFFDSKMGDAPRVQGDILQETFVNTTAAWLNLLFLSSCGPIKTPVGACATAVESVSIGYDAIRTGQAKVMVVGAYDDLNEESSVEFANMKATSNTDSEIANGRNPGDMCRPMSSTRAGFMESHGAGILLLMSGDLALQMGVPICGVVAMAHTATDSAGRSVPAPGKGLLSAVAEDAAASRRSPLLSLSYRRRQLETELAGLAEWRRGELQTLRVEAELGGGEVRESIEAMEEEYERLVSAARRRWGTDWADGHASISPMRAALAVWGLTADDIAMASCHGTSTKLNDKNESDLLNTQMTTLGRSKGNPMYVVTQKWLTGHPKGPAAAWQLAGAMQAMMMSVVPGNRNLDDTDSSLEQFEHLMYTNRTLRLRKHFEAISVTSFGFGQAGGQVLLVHPDRFLATLSREAFAAYTAKWKARRGAAFQRRQEILSNRVPLVQVKEGAPYEAAKQAIMNLLARSGGQQKTSPSPCLEEPATAALDSSVKAAVSAALGSSAENSGVGIDVERFDLPCFGSDTFLSRNFTSEEREDCRRRALQTGRADGRRPLAGLWAGKEAVLKALGNAAGGGLRGGGGVAGASASAADVVLRRPAGEGPVAVELRASAAALAKAAGVQSVSLTLSYTDELAVAAAVTHAEDARTPAS